MGEEVKGEELNVEKETGINWESFLPRGCLRVLLVEPDDSTRQIIGALLRKCSYKVAAVPDGRMAWQILKENPHNFDIVLTEVIMPTISGFALLSMIMGHEICRKVPVIMMSSQDSISIVLKCMLKGASDFLLKPIRKNELRNVWQHVWRRHSSNIGGITCQEGNPSQLKLEALSENNAASNHSSEYIACAQKNKENSEKGSDAQSSCTRPDLEVESADTQSSQEFSLQQGRSIPQELQLKVNEAAEARRPEKSYCDQAIVSTSQTPEAEGDCAKPLDEEESLNLTGFRDGANADSINDHNSMKFTFSGQAIDLIGEIDRQRMCQYSDTGTLPQREHLSRGMASPFDLKDNMSPSGSVPLWELSLRRPQFLGFDRQEKEERHILHHSNASAFSRYNNQTAHPSCPASTSFCPGVQESNAKAHLPMGTQTATCHSITDQYPSSLKREMHHALKENTMQLESKEEEETPKFSPSLKDSKAFPCPQMGVISFPVPIRGRPFDGVCTGYGAVLQPIFYAQPSLPPWDSPHQQEAQREVDPSHQSDQASEQSHNSDHDHHITSHEVNQPVSLPLGQKHEVQLEPKEAQKSASPATGQSASTVCNGSQTHVNGSGCGSVCNGGSGNINNDSGSNEGLLGHNGNSIDYHRSSQREAALNKFRLKRKDRCFEKKVRYQSRKRLAEQRPRVKGQFVRQSHQEPTSMETDCPRNDILTL
ncbi:hypothetical protein AMTRI_Chr09g36960 [Amborella trichopoda]